MHSVSQKVLVRLSSLELWSVGWWAISLLSQDSHYKYGFLIAGRRFYDDSAIFHGALRRSSQLAN